MSFGLGPLNHKIKPKNWAMNSSIILLGFLNMQIGLNYQRDLKTYHKLTKNHRCTSGAMVKLHILERLRVWSPYLRLIGAKSPPSPPPPKNDQKKTYKKPKSQTMSHLISLWPNSHLHTPRNTDFS